MRHPRSFLVSALLGALFFVLSTPRNLAQASVPDWTPPLTTRGRYVVDANGQRFKLMSGNWHGGSGTWTGTGDPNVDSNSHDGENSHNMPLGLQYVPISDILDSFEALGINSIRFQFSNEMIHDTSIINDSWVAANPQLQGLTALEVFDACIAALTQRKFAVILNNHTNKNRWCCSVGDGNERWDESQSEEQWIDDWLFMVNRYQNNSRVVGADLYNEVRRDIVLDPTWGDATTLLPTDWYAAAQHAGDRILTEVNPNLLIIIEGINWVGIPTDVTPHGRPLLTPVQTLSSTLVESHQLVYSVHYYAYTGPNHSGATGIGETKDPRYRDLSVSDLYAVYNSSGAYVALSNDNHFNAPVWFSEFGVESIGISSSDQAWFQNTITYLVQYDIDFAIWPLVGYLFNGRGDGWALMNWDLVTGKRDGLFDGNDWRVADWGRLVNATTYSFGTMTEEPHWRMLNVDVEDCVKSSTMLARGDWDSGARKAACPDGLRLIGLSTGARGLCTDAQLGSSLWDDAKDTVTVYNQSFVSPSAPDWATGFTKYQCPPNQYVIGYAVRGPKVSTVLCAASGTSLGNNSRTLWFNQGDNRADGTLGADFAVDEFKGQCSQSEYIGGVAFSVTFSDEGNPAALLCMS